MKKIFVIHGAYGNPKENWFPWLKAALEKLGCEVFIPEFPTPEGQNLENWKKAFRDYIGKMDKDSIFVGHSVACSFILNILEEINYSIKASFLVAGWTGFLGNSFDKINKTFVDRNFNWEKIKQNCQKFYLFNSNNDPYVPLDLGKKLANHIEGELLIVENAGHFNKKAGYEKFDLLLEKIKEEL